MKTNIIKTIIVKICLLGLILTVTSCNFNNKLSTQVDADENLEISDSNEIVLGKKINNPFSIRTNRSIADETPNYYYFKIKP